MQNKEKGSREGPRDGALEVVQINVGAARDELAYCAPAELDRLLCVPAPESGMPACDNGRQGRQAGLTGRAATEETYTEGD